MSDTLILVAQADAVRTLTLNRPAALNSFTGEMHAQLMTQLDAAAADEEVRCLVLTGSGRAFCAGQDLADPLVSPPAGDAEPAKDLGEVVRRLYAPLVKRLRSMPVPVVAAVNGIAAGAGANLALGCDIVLAGRSASFIQAFAKIGLIPDTGGTWLLGRLAGRQRALGMAMLGDKLSAQDAERIGLVWRCIEDGDLQEEARRIANRLAAMPTRALVATRKLLDDAQQISMDEALAREAVAQGELGVSHDYREGVAAFYAKRAPRFTDR